MKLSCLPVSLFRDITEGRVSLREWAEYGKSLGLDAIDLMMVLLKNHTPVYLNSVRKDLEEAGIGIAMITTYPDFTHPDALQREREVEYLKHDIACASQVDAKFLRITAGQDHPGTGVEEGVLWAVENFKAVVPTAEKFGVQLVYEDHSKPGAWDYMDFSLQPEIFLRIADAIRDTGIKINFDTANIQVAGHETTVEVLEKVIDMVETIHVAETATLGKADPVLIGEGIVPIEDVFRCLKRHGFDNWLCIEEWGNQGMEGIRKAVEKTRELWENA